jgi:1-deoxy-D-xylulose-5-phosphate synthase
MVMPDSFIDQDKPDRMYAQAGLDAGAIVAKVFDALGMSESGRNEAGKTEPASSRSGTGRAG